MTEPEVAWWLKRALIHDGLRGQPVRGLITDSDGSYRNSPFKKRLEPFGTVWIQGKRPDLVGLDDQGGSPAVLAFEVKGRDGHEKGVTQAATYRHGSHSSYLAIPDSSLPPNWLTTTAQQLGVGLIAVAVAGIQVLVPAAPPLPDPHAVDVTYRTLRGEQSLRAFGLNRPLHYVAAACALRTADPESVLKETWGLKAMGHAVRGADALGLLANGALTPRGRAYTDLFQALGFSLASDSDRRLTGARCRLATDAPAYASALRTLFLEHPAVDLVVRTLELLGGEATITSLASRARSVDEGTSLAVFGDPNMSGWAPRPSTIFQLKATLFDIGILDTRLAPGASNLRTGRYRPSDDVWGLRPETFNR